MKILQINNVYGIGSTGKITRNIHLQLLKDGMESVVLYGRGRMVCERGVYRTGNDFLANVNHLFSEISGIRYGGCWYSTEKIFNIIRRERPDIVHLQCINDYFVDIYRLVEWLKKQNIPTVLTLHAEFMFTANCSHAFECEKWKSGCGNCPSLYQATKSLFFDRTHKSYKKMKNAFDGFEDFLEVISVSPWLQNRAQQSPILAGMHHRVIFNGVDTSVFHPCSDDLIEQKFCVQGRKIVFQATALFRDTEGDPKGGTYVLDLAQEMKDKRVLFLIAGKYIVHDTVPENVILLGEIQNQRELAAYYSRADVTLLTSKRETYSMVCAESLCCGTPVVGFEAGGPEQISIPEYSSFVPQGDLEALKAELIHWINLPKQSGIADAAKKKYGIDNMYKSYLRVYKELMDRIHEK